MLKEEIIVGRSYVNEHASVIREVVGEADGHHVSYNAFDLDTGKLIPGLHRVCHVREMARWADREAQEIETARIHPYGPAASVDAFLSREQGTLKPEQARRVIDAAPGTHTFPRIK
jgi:hypothetical protein